MPNLLSPPSFFGIALPFGSVAESNTLTVSLAALCLVGYSPQEGWLTVFQSDSVWCELPLRATYFRQD
jgi:hypothetical protein